MVLVKINSCSGRPNRGSGRSCNHHSNSNDKRKIELMMTVHGEHKWQGSKLKDADRVSTRRRNEMRVVQMLNSRKKGEDDGAVVST